MKPKISCVCCTYRRFHCIERIIQYFLNQTYTNSELVIYNTDMDHPLKLDETLKECEKRITIINNGIDLKTKLPYTNVGAIRRDSILYTKGDYYNCFDDDDIFLPHHLQQLIDGIERTKRKAFKPSHSFFRKGDGTIEICKNVFEASLLVDIKELNFNLTSGSEHLGWYDRLRDEGELNENEPNTLPAYCFDWIYNPIASHKQSGEIDNQNNFENHKARSTDYAIRPLTTVDVSSYYQPFQSFFSFQLF